MPIYEYECPACSQVVEVMQDFDAPAPSECPACGKHAQMAKVMSRTSFQLKGTGWYTTDYKRASTSAAPASAAPKASDSTSAASTPTAPAAATAAPTAEKSGT